MTARRCDCLASPLPLVDPDEDGRWPKWIAFLFIAAVGLTIWRLIARAWVFVSVYYSP